VQLVVRKALPADGATLVRFLDAAYRGGYSPTFDRDGPLQPNDLWWVQSEKDVEVIEIDRTAAGALVIGRHRGQWLVEELLLPGFGAYPARTQQAVLQRTSAHLAARFQRGGQASLLLRAAETNSFALALAGRMDAVFANALLVFRYRGPRRPTVRVPEGYQLARATPAEARAVGRLARETIPDRSRTDEIERVLGTKDGRGYVATRNGVLVGFAIVETRAGRGDWHVGVRDSHRRCGVGRALATQVLAALSARERAPFATVWALDPVAGGFLSSLGYEVERSFLYLERSL
jgi:ribosomal protein S18 acetylase RimI-like enzyme